MPCCCVYKCSERTEKGVRLFLLPQGPKNSERRKQWIKNINRKGCLPEKPFICEKHFTHDQFENNRQDNKRPLRWNAVPTLFSHKNIPKARKLPKIRIDKENKVENFPNSEFMIQVPPVETHLFDQHDDEQVTTSVQEETNLRVVELQRKLELAQKTIRKLNKESETLKMQLNTIFNEDQIRCLQRGHIVGSLLKQDNSKMIVLSKTDFNV